MLLPNLGDEVETLRDKEMFGFDRTKGAWFLPAGSKASVTKVTARSVMLRAYFRNKDFPAQEGKEIEYLERLSNIRVTAKQLTLEEWQ